MPITVAQRDLIDSLVDDFLGSTVEQFKTTSFGPSAVQMLLELSGRGDRVAFDRNFGRMQNANLIWQNSRSLMNVLLGNTNIFANQPLGANPPSQPEVVAAVYRAIISVLHRRFSQFYDDHTATDIWGDPYYKLPMTSAGVSGMAKIRELTCHFFNTQLSSIEMHLLTLEILIEKELLNIPSYITANEVIRQSWNSRSLIGDFSGLNLSKLELIRDPKLNRACFKGWKACNTNFDGCTFEADMFGSANFEGSSLRGAHFVHKPDSHRWFSPILNNADLEGALTGEIDVSPSRQQEQPKNSHLRSSNLQELEAFRRDKLGMIPVVAAPVVPSVAVSSSASANPVVANPVVFNQVRPNRKRTETEMLGNQEPLDNETNIGGYSLRGGARKKAK